MANMREELDEGCEKAYADVTADWLAGSGYAGLLGDTIQAIPEPTGRAL
jgi:hypothetical protein